MWRNFVQFPKLPLGRRVVISKQRMSDRVLTSHIPALNILVVLSMIEGPRKALRCDYKKVRSKGATLPDSPRKLDERRGLPLTVNRSLTRDSKGFGPLYKTRRDPNLAHGLPNKVPVQPVISFREVNFEHKLLAFALVKDVKRLLQENNAVHYVSTFDEGRLIMTNQPVQIRLDSKGQGFGNNFVSGTH